MQALHTAVRGRTRSPVPGLYGSEALTQRLVWCLRACVGLHDIAARTLTGPVLVRFQPDLSVAAGAALLGAVLTAHANAVQAWNGTQGSSVSANGARPATPLPAARAAGARRRTVQWADLPTEAPRAVPWYALAAAAVAAALATTQESGRSQATA
jgi:hypothetical protein